MCEVADALRNLHPAAESLDKMQIRLPVGLAGVRDVEEIKRFAESFAKWAVGDIGLDLNVGYKVMPPEPSLSAWTRKQPSDVRFNPWNWNAPGSAPCAAPRRTSSASISNRASKCSATPTS